MSIRTINRRETLVRLSDLLDRVQPDHPVWVSLSGQRIRAADLQDWLRSARAIALSFRRKKVAILAANDLELGTLLLLFDGVASEMAILPTGQDERTLQAIVIESKIDSVVTIGGEITVPGCDVVTLDIPPVGTFLRSDRCIPMDVRPQSRSTASAFQTHGVGGTTTRSVCVEDRAPAGGGSVDGQMNEVLPTRWILPTSGTTGRPKLVSHTLASLSRSVKSDLERGKEFVWGSLYSLGSFAGLQVFLQSLFGGSTIILSNDSTTLTDRIAAFCDLKCNALSATPTMWRMILMTGAANSLDLKRITLGGEICDQPILDQLRKLFPTARVTHIYASTEAGVGFAVRDGMEGFPAHFLSEPPDGIQLRRSEAGTLLVKPAKLEQSYSDPQRELAGSDGFIDTEDMIERRGDRFHFAGRASGMINVGGRKVHPHDVERALLKHPAVSMARVSAKRNPFTGSIVESEVVLAEGAELDPVDAPSILVRFCRESLEPYKVPAIVSLVDSIEISATGKIKR
ncbi:Long-chain-fatty-acid--CoA ligase [Stieleria neptunia]|uniref:Long-chain-fatty-acid--CoA ligase n=1 Tax=Stieleria neptunia TaxID=2527979 RepID=A0A518HN65_9BACT|nr:fatty acid--CoA ligase family protein [Stieleria neptunia]QDV42292.1 Long-chain-fatty-acid--CoA ligase [Stieleria neptunia]